MKKLLEIIQLCQCEMNEFKERFVLLEKINLF